MLDLFNIAKPQGCDIQIFYGSGAANTSTTANSRSWNKPRGASNIYMLLIGAGGWSGGSGTTGGGSGAVTVWYGSAINVPDVLNIVVGALVLGNANNTEVTYRSANTVNILLRANSASTTTGGAAFTANQFAASGFFQSVSGQNGASTQQTASATTFLSGGGIASSITANYGYSVSGNPIDGFFQLQPIIVGMGGAGAGKGGIGCGAGSAGSSGNEGGPGMVLIASW